MSQITILGFDVAPGTSTSFVIGREFKNKLPKPFNDCYEDLTSLDSYDSDLYRRMIMANTTYRQVDCFRLCYQKQMVEKCKCFDISAPVFFGARACNTYEQLICLNLVYERFKVDEECIKNW